MNKSITRRILALAIGLPYVAVAAYLAVMGSMEAFVAFGVLATTVIGFYFGTKATST